jgi:ADP-ribosylglycohydrolase
MKSIAFLKSIFDIEVTPMPNGTIKDKIRGAILGLCVGDALGVPVEFYVREVRKLDPVAEMRGGGFHNQPAGTWSDDSSLMFALTDSLAERGEFDAEDVMRRFADWLNGSAYSPHGEMFDVGGTTADAIDRFVAGTSALKCGGTGEMDNGNGALMRILPMAIFVKAEYDKKEWHGKPAYPRAAEFHELSQAVKLTHAHPRNVAACFLYSVVAAELMSGRDKFTAVENAVHDMNDFCNAERAHFARFLDPRVYENLDESGSMPSRKVRACLREFVKLPESKIRSGGYVIDTLEAALWCFLTTDSYAECVLKAVNLGEDTDTTAAVAGGLAGLLYGVDAIPEEWLATLARREWIYEICDKFSERFADGLE